MGAEIYGISDKIPTTPSMFEALNLGNRIHDYRLDLCDLERLKKIFVEVQPDFVFHLAAQPIVSVSYADPVQTITTNVLGTMNVLECLRQLNYPCIAIIITSDKCYDNVEWVWGYKETDRMGGKDIYSGSKGAAELVFKSYYVSFFSNSDCNIRVASARAGNVIGGGDWALDRIVPDCMRAWFQKKNVEIRCPQSTRPWQHVLEPLSGYLNLAVTLSEDSSLSGQSFNFGPASEYNRTVLDLLSDLAARWDFEKAEEAYIVVDNLPFHEAGLLKLNCDKSLFYLKWMATLDYEQLIRFTGDWYYEYYHNNGNMYEYTIAQIQEYENIAINKNIAWTK
jgi:CDP-glucose 4,6-dehydratase